MWCDQSTIPTTLAHQCPVSGGREGGGRRRCHLTTTSHKSFTCPTASVPSIKLDYSPTVWCNVWTNDGTACTNTFLPLLVLFWYVSQLGPKQCCQKPFKEIEIKSRTSNFFLCCVPTFDQLWPFLLFLQMRLKFSYLLFSHCHDLIQEHTSLEQRLGKD